MDLLPESKISSVHDALGLNLLAPLSRLGHPWVLTAHQSLGRPGNRKKCERHSAVAFLSSVATSLLPSGHAFRPPGTYGPPPARIPTTPATLRRPPALAPPPSPTPTRQPPPPPPTCRDPSDLMHRSPCPTSHPCTLNPTMTPTQPQAPRPALLQPPGSRPSTAFFT